METCVEEEGRGWDWNESSKHLHSLVYISRVYIYLFCTIARNEIVVELFFFTFITLAAKTPRNEYQRQQLLLLRKELGETFSKKRIYSLLHGGGQQHSPRSSTAAPLMKRNPPLAECWSGKFYFSRKYPRSNYSKLEISSANSREKERKRRVSRESGTWKEGGKERERRSRTKRVEERDRFEADLSSSSMVAALKADGAPETSSKKKDKESRNDRKEIHAAGRDRAWRKGRKTFALGES